ncbi:protein ripply3 isoform X2 [Malurus melanocephalus]|uniref:protein ripply3 isoform X2 n=1 Tax=Malurus melanocephalus TaxID=175006 RepID=UPI0025493A9F|nr:protein ripply3 isoform X2 [Malurus melanocephalus]
MFLLLHLKLKKCQPCAAAISCPTERSKSPVLLTWHLTLLLCVTLSHAGTQNPCLGTSKERKQAKDPISKESSPLWNSLSPGKILTQRRGSEPVPAFRASMEGAAGKRSRDCRDCRAGLHLGSPALWRPWMLSARDGAATENQQMPESDGQLINYRSKGALGFQHPVRLYLPKSKSQKFLDSTGEKVLANFPVQATIHFYNDDTDSEEEEEKVSSA